MHMTVYWCSNDIGQRPVSTQLEWIKRIQQKQASYFKLALGLPFSVKSTQINLSHLSGTVLHRCGQSAARDYFFGEEGNRQIIFDENYRTAYVVLHNERDPITNVLPHQRIVDMHTAQIVFRSLVCSQMELYTLFEEIGILPGLLTDPSSVLDVLKKYFTGMAVVIAGEVAESSISEQPLICTCRRFLLRSACQHVLFVEGLEVGSIRKPTRRFENMRL